MIDVVVLKEKYSPVNLQVLDEIYRLRYRVFHERLGWEVQTKNEREYDYYDSLNPVYMAVMGRDQQAQACWRFLPTTGPNMLNNTFPQLLRGETPPCSEEIWELSRFAVAATQEDPSAQAVVNPVTMQLIRAAYDYAIGNGIKSFVTVTSVAVERLLKRLGLPVYRFGDGKAQRIGTVLTVACWVDINKQYYDVVYPAGDISVTGDEAA